MREVFLYMKYNLTTLKIYFKQGRKFKFFCQIVLKYRKIVFKYWKYILNTLKSVSKYIWFGKGGNRHNYGQKENLLKLFRSRRQSSEKLNNPRPLFSRIKELYFSKEVKENALALIRRQIMPTINNNRRKLICLSRPLSVK